MFVYFGGWVFYILNVFNKLWNFPSFLAISAIELPKGFDPVSSHGLDLLNKAFFSSPMARLEDFIFQEHNILSSWPSFHNSLDICQEIYHCFLPRRASALRVVTNSIIFHLGHMSVLTVLLLREGLGLFIFSLSLCHLWISLASKLLLSVTKH